MTAKWNWIKIESHGITNGLLRLKLDGIILPLHTLLFKLQYKKITNNTASKLEWNSFLFDYEYICKYPYDYINIRLDTHLYDYDIYIRVTSTDDNIRKDKQNMKWFSWSNTITINIPSLMKEQSFKINDWIRFKRPKRDYWTYGTLQEIITDNDNEIIYKILHYRKSKIYEIINPQLRKNIKRLTVHSYIDLTDQINIENMLLIGDRINVQNEYVCDIYHLLNNIFYTQYVKTDDFLYDNITIDCISMSKCIALHVINYLWNKHKGYKIKCLLSKNDNDHFNNQIKLISQREYAVGRSIDLKKPSIVQGTIYYCDICLCRQGDYYYMFRCQKEYNKEYHGHDMCLTCIYDTINRYNELIMLLNELLMNELTHDCIQTVVVYAAGNVVKL